MAATASTIAPRRRPYRTDRGPWRFLDMANAYDRRIRAIALQLLADAPDAPPLLVEDTIALATLRVRADVLRADPSVSPGELSQLEYCVLRRSEAVEAKIRTLRNPVSPKSGSSLARDLERMRGLRL